MVARVVVFGLVCAGSLLLSHVASAEVSPACSTRDVEYALGGTIQLTETPLGKGDGAYKVGPGSMVLRFDDSGAVKLLSYSMREAFTIRAKALTMSATVTVDTRTRVTPNACGVAAEGRVAEGKIVWNGKVRGYRADGTLSCEGGLCGGPGVPPSGASEFHVAPSDVQFRPFELSKDGKTFTMPYTFVAKTKVPQQTAFLALTGREVRRTCVQPKPCP